MPLLDPDTKAEVVVALPSVEEQAPLLHRFPVADLEHPWLGLESFREESRGYFFGRDAEITEIHLRLRSHPLLVVYGRSGAGKTSILNAGLIPRLRAEGHSPALLRLNYKGDGPFDQLFAVLFESDNGAPVARFPKKKERITAWETDMAASLARLPSQQKNSNELVVPFSFPQDAASRLWLRLHWRKEPPNITHLILDQFQEVFTIGARRAGAETEVRDALAIFLQGSIPDPIVRLIADHDDFLDYFDPDSTPVRILLALRDDYVYALNLWKSSVFSLGQNNFELRALRGPAALESVFEPGALRCRYRGEVSEQKKADTGRPPIVTKETAQRIVRFVAKKGDDVPMEEIEAFPPILSLLCRELNERRFTEPAGRAEIPADQITLSESDTDVETIIKSFYERCVTGRPEAVRVFIEDELVSRYSGARLPQDEQSIVKVFTDGCEIPGAAGSRRAAGYGDSVKARECLIDLVNQRFLTFLGGGDNPSYELIHDLVAAEAAKSRTARGERYEKEQADLRAEADRKAREEAESLAQVERQRAEVQARATRRARLFASAAIVVALLAAYAWFIAFTGRSETERQRGEAEQARNKAVETERQRGEAEQAGNKAVAAKFETERQRGEAEQARNKAIAAKKPADELIKILRYDLREALEKVDLAHALRRVNGNPARCVPGRRAALEASLAIREKLVKQDPDNAGWQRDLSVNYDKVGDLQSAQGDLAGALQSYCDSLAISEKLTKQDPANADWQRDLSVSYNKVANVQSAQDDLAGALQSYRDGLAISEKLAKQNPGNAGWQADLAFSYWRTGTTLARSDPQSKKDARTMVENGRDILRELKTRTGLMPQQQLWLEAIEADLRKMHE